MAWSVLQAASAAGTTGANTKAATFTTANLSSGTKLIACFGWNNLTVADTVTSVADTHGTMTQVGLVNDTTNTASAAIYAMDTPALDVGTKPTITITFGTGMNPECSMVILEVSGLATGSTLAAMIDGGALAASNSGSAPPLNSGTYSSTASNEFLIGVFGDNGGPETIAKPSAWSNLSGSSVNNNSIANCCVAYTNSKNGSEGGTSGQWTRSAGSGTGCACLLTAFKLAAGVTPAPFYPADQPARARIPSPYAQGRPGLLYIY
jgi:hypothetical protein